MVHEQHKGLTLGQWFPKYVLPHTAAPPDVIRCATKNVEIKINQVEFGNGIRSTYISLGKEKG